MAEDPCHALKSIMCNMFPVDLFAATSFTGVASWPSCAFVCAQRDREEDCAHTANVDLSAINVSFTQPGD